MIIPLWVGTGRPHFKVWPLFLLLLANILIFLLIEHIDEQAPGDGTDILNLIGSEKAGLVHLFVSNMLHLDSLHLLFNMWFLWLFGAPIAGGLRPSNFFILYFLSAITGTFLQDVMSHSGSIGSSGAVSGMMGFFFTHFLRQPVSCLLIIFPITLPAWMLIIVYLAPDLYSAYTGEDSYVAYWAHLGGFLVGIVFGGIIKRLDEIRL